MFTLHGYEIWNSRQKSKYDISYPTNAHILISGNKIFRFHLLSINAQDIKDVISNFGSCHVGNFVAFCLSR